MKITPTLLFAAIASLALSGTTSWAMELAPVPKLTGKECLRNFCLGDELGKFKPGTFHHRFPTLRLDAMTRKATDVQRILGPKFAQIDKRLLEDIVIETHSTQGIIDFHISLTPTIHEGLLKGPLKVCAPMDLMARVSDITDGEWTVVFRAVPEKQVAGRQAWILTQVEARTEGLFSDAEVEVLRKQLKERAREYVHVNHWGGVLTTQLNWVPFTRKGWSGDSDIQTPGRDDELRVIYGCLKPSELPKF